MTAYKLSPQDRKDLDKFSKYLVYKCIQVIIQSRLGDKVRSQSKSYSSGSDWFNLAIRDLPEVLSEIKKVLPTGLIDLGQNVNVEMSLRTVEGETMVLETWTIGMIDVCDHNAKVSYAVYNRMGIMLKSLICLSRITPTYQLSRKQGADTYVICYRIYLGEPQLQHLGEGIQSLKVAAVPSPAGTIILHVRYRTKMSISPQPCSRDLTADLKMDHFVADYSPRKVNVPKPCHYANRKRSCSGCPEEIPPSEVESCTTTFSTSPSDQIQSNVQSNVCQLHGFSNGGNVSSNFAQKLNYCNHVNKYSDDFSDHVDIRKMSAFAPQNRIEKTNDDIDDIPFMSLLQNNEPEDSPCTCQFPIMHDNDPRNEVPMDQISRSSTGTSTGSSTNKSGFSQASEHGPDHDDFVMVELKTPFAGQDANTDLGRFYREFQNAPQLKMFSDTVNIEDAINSVTNQLQLFQASAKEFDEFASFLENTE